MSERKLPWARYRPWEVGAMGIMEFRVCRQGREARWVVRLGNDVYGAYLDKENALLETGDAPRAATRSGREAQVWVSERSSPPRTSSGTDSPPELLSHLPL